MKLMFNEDWIQHIWSRHEYRMEVTEQTLRDFIYQYKDTQITDFAMNVNGSVSTCPSTVFQTFADKYSAEEEAGIPVDYKHTYAAMAHHIFVEQGLDMYAIWIQCLREIGIRPWVSIRMNDCHGNGSTPELRQSEYVLKHPEQWRIRHRKADEYWDRCLDFGLQEVREYMLSYITEVVERYDMDGLELDFTREGFLFAPGREKAGKAALEALLTDIRALCSRQPHGRPIRINALVNGSPSTCLAYGIDPGRWARLGLIDSLVVLPRWDTINTDYPLDLWRYVVGEHVELGAGHQLLVRPCPQNQGHLSNMDMAFGQACANLYNGADFVYLYNYFDLYCPTMERHSTSLREKAHVEFILRNIGDYETASRQRRCHVVTYDDFPPYWEELHARLPISLVPNQRKYVKIPVGGIREHERVTLRLGFAEPVPAKEMTVFVNCTEAVWGGPCQLDRNITNARGYSFVIQNRDLDGYAMAELVAPFAAELIYVDILIEPRETLEPHAAGLSYADIQIEVPEL